MIHIRFAILNPHDIFSSIGRCGGGHGCVWEDWSPSGRTALKQISEEWERRMDGICGHYSKLEQSILKEGFNSPLILTCGPPSKRRLRHIPPELRGDRQLLIMEGGTGGSRLWVAKKHNLPVPCLINDKVGRFKNETRITSMEQAQSYFVNPPNLTVTNGELQEVVNSATPSHLDAHWHNVDNLVQERGPLWVELMTKYGYNVKIQDTNTKKLIGRKSSMPTSHHTYISDIIGLVRQQQPRSVLDIGVGFGKYGFLIREYCDVMLGRVYPNEWKVQIDGIEIFSKYIQPHQTHIYNNIHIGNAVELIDGMQNYDIIIISDVIEHIPKEQALDLIRKLRSKSKTLIMAIPMGDVWLGNNAASKLDNPAEAHVSSWTDSDLLPYKSVKTFMCNKKPINLYTL